MFTQVDISLTKVHIYAKSNDNGITIKGKTAEGYKDRTILKDNPEGPQKAADLLQEIHDFHAQKLTDAQTELADQFPAMLDEVESEFNREEESA